jgi:hypothetical protein
VHRGRAFANKIYQMSNQRGGVGIGPGRVASKNLNVIYFEMVIILNGLTKKNLKYNLNINNNNNIGIIKHNLQNQKTTTI